MAGKPSGREKMRSFVKRFLILLQLEEESQCWETEPLLPAVLKQCISYHRHKNISALSSEWNYFCICKGKFDQIPKGREADTQTIFFLINKPIPHCERLTTTTDYQQH